MRLTEPFDYTTFEFDRLVVEVSGHSRQQTDELLRVLRLTDTDEYLALGTAARVVASHQAAARIQEHLVQLQTQLIIHVVQPMFREGRRLLPRSIDNPYGEDAMGYKLGRLDSLSAQFPRINFSVLAVDDGCDSGGDPSLISSRVAREVIEEYRAAHPDSPVKTEVLLLSDLIREAPALGWESRMANTGASRKGGSVLAGFAYARRQASRRANRLHLFVDCDADLSVHVDQIMLLAEQILLGGNDGAVASRRHESSISYIDPERDQRGQRYIQAWQVLLPALAAQVVDTNRGLKAYSRHAVDIILDTVEERTFPYQIECLLALVLSGARVAEVPVSYIDSVALSTQSGTAVAQEYTDQLDRIRQIAIRYDQIA